MVVTAPLYLFIAFPNLTVEDTTIHPVAGRPILSEPLLGGHWELLGR